MKPVEPVVLSRSDMSIVKASIARKLTSYNKKCSGAYNGSGLCVTFGSSRTCLFCDEQIHAVNHVYVYTASIITKTPLEDVNRTEEALGAMLSLGQRLVISRDVPVCVEAGLYEMDEWFE